MPCVGMRLFFEYSQGSYSFEAHRKFRKASDRLRNSPDPKILLIPKCVTIGACHSFSEKVQFNSKTRHILHFAAGDILDGYDSCECSMKRKSCDVTTANLTTHLYLAQSNLIRTMRDPGSISLSLRSFQQMPEHAAFFSTLNMHKDQI